MDSTHTIVVGPAGWNSYNNLDEMPIYPDDNLIYTFHFYDPFLFTHQGASWTDPSMVSLAGVPFPYGAAAMPACPPELIGTWIQSELSNYSNVGTVAALQNTLDIAVEFGASRGVPVFCGEFGVLMDNADNDHRVAWYAAVSSYLDSMDIGWTAWDYHGGFGVFEQGSNGLFDHDLNIPLLEAMGFNTPPQTEFSVEADTSGFYLYEDHISEHIISQHNTHGTLNMYDTNNPHSGDYCIYWSGAEQYDIIGFRFSPNKDLSELVDENYVLTLWIKSAGTPSSIDLRFLDSKTAEPDDHPWRMGITLGASDLEWNEDWQYVQLPLNDLEEKGSWDNAWYEPAGLFDWSAVDVFELVAEHNSWTDTEFWFDDIRIVDPDAAYVKTSGELPLSFTLIKNYPNPFNSQTSILYSLSERAFTELSIFDIQGRLVATPLVAYKNPGKHELIWNTSGSNTESGVYFAILKVGTRSRMIKMLYLK